MLKHSSSYAMVKVDGLDIREINDIAIVADTNCYE